MNIKPLTETQAELIKASLIDNYFQVWGVLDLSSQKALGDLEAHLIRRYAFTLHTLMPWVGRFARIENAKVVEIGSGTGSIACAFATKAADVRAYDIDDSSHQCAEDRARILGVDGKVEFRCLPPEQLLPVVERENQDVDIVVLYATLEHQKIEERFASLKSAWSILKPGGVLMIGQTPNRLTYFHPHTSQTPFFDMIPDEVMWRFLERMPASPFTQKMRGYLDESIEYASEKLARWGRGVSFHEFQIVLGDLMSITVGHGFEDEIMKVNPLTLEERLLMTYVLEEKLDVPIGFCRRWLTLVLQKPGGEKADTPQFDSKFLTPPMQAAY